MFVPFLRLCRVSWAYVAFFAFTSAVFAQPTPSDKSSPTAVASMVSTNFLAQPVRTDTAQTENADQNLPRASDETYSLCDTILLSIFNKHAPKREFTPLYLSTFFTDGWLQPHVAPPETTGGSVRQGWAGLNDVFFNRMIDTIFSAFHGKNGRRNEQVFVEDIETPISRRWMIGVITLWLDALDGNGQSSAASYGDTIIENRFVLHESQDLSVTANINFRVPTGSSSTGNDQTSFIGYIGWYIDLGFQGWSFRGLVGITDPLTGANADRVVSFIQTFGLGQTLTKHDVPWFGDFTYYVVVDLTEAENTKTFVSITPGIRTHLGRGWYLLVGLEVPVTANAGFSERINLQLVKGF